MVDVRHGGRMAGAVLAGAVAAALGGGCASAPPGERPMTAALFMPPVTAVAAPATPAEAEVPVEQPARAVVRPDPGVPTVDGTSPKNAMILTPGPSSAFEAVRPLTPLASASPPVAVPTTMPAVDPPAPASAPSPDVAPDAAPTPPAPPVTGVYMTVGGVLAQVNETPIFAHTVLALLDRELAARARDMEPEEFKRFATDKITAQLTELVRDEMDYSTALKSLTEDDQKTARALAAQDRAEKVKQSGGSLELARRRAADDGFDFEEQMTREYRRIVVGLYQRREIDPQVQVSAQDMREFYAATAAKLYADKDRLKFRVIEIDPAQRTGDHPREAALAAAAKVRAGAVAGADFAALAASPANDDPGLRSGGGDPGGWMDRGSYRVDAVEQALWALRPGGVTPVVEAEGAFYVAKLEDKHEGQTRPFDDAAVQDDVFKKLTQRQVAALWERIRDATLTDAVIYAPPERLETALEMVMQKYARWAAK